MSGLLLIAHAPLATALQAVANHVFPDCKAYLEALDVTPDMSIDDVLEASRRLLARIGQNETLILTDVFGATPCNAALHLVDDVHVGLLAGVNVPMLWRALCYSTEPLSQLIQRASSGGVQGITQIAAPDISAT